MILVKHLQRICCSCTSTVGARYSLLLLHIFLVTYGDWGHMVWVAVVIIISAVHQLFFANERERVMSYFLLTAVSRSLLQFIAVSVNDRLWKHY